MELETKNHFSDIEKGHNKFLLINPDQFNPDTVHVCKSEWNL